MLSELTKIPIDEIPNALMAFDILFPLETNNSWFLRTNSNIKLLKFIPPQLCGVGANFRRIIYRQDDKNVTYDDLKQQCNFRSSRTLQDLIKYNNLLIEYLYLDSQIRE